MTDMKRITISLPDDLDKLILKLKQSPSLAGCSYSEVVRRLLEMALDWME